LQTAWGLGEKSSSQSNERNKSIPPKPRLSSGYRTHPSSSSHQTSSFSSSSVEKTVNSRFSSAIHDLDHNSKALDTNDKTILTDNKSQNSVSIIHSNSENEKTAFQPTNFISSKISNQVSQKDETSQPTDAKESDSDVKYNDSNDTKTPNVYISNKEDLSVQSNPVSIVSENEPPPTTIEAKHASNDVDEQVEYMKRRARERAEERKAEEEARMNEQKERAARRLKELEDKMHYSHNSSNDSKYEKKNWRGQNINLVQPGIDFRNSNKNSEIILERLGRPNEKKKLLGETNNYVKNASTSSSSTRKLYDPNRTYSSLLGGATPSKVHQTSFHKHSELLPPPVLQISLNAACKDESFDYQNEEEVGCTQPPIAMIQLNNYEDRDRGQRNMSSGPRMLFDPKSGSMIQAPSFDKRNVNQYIDDSTQSGKGRKDRVKLKSRNRERDNKIDSGLGHSHSKRSDVFNAVSIDDQNKKRSQYGETDESNDTKALRRQRKKEEINDYRKENKRVDRDTRYKNDNLNQLDDTFLRQGYMFDDNGIRRRYGNRSVQRRRSGSNGMAKLPRTRGVLYRLDDSGNYICVDGCEADQGYGAHSVPGGRIRNPNAHAEYLMRCHNMQQPLLEVTSSTNDYDHSNIGERHLSQNNFTKFIGTEGQLKRRSVLKNQNVFSGEYSHNQYEPSHYKMKQQNPSVKGKVQNGGYELPPQLRVKANETLSIFSGVPESPELQATANPWAPNEAALAAAAANSSIQMGGMKRGESDESETSHNVTVEMMRIIDEPDEDIVDNDSDSKASYIGLGFDPTENMDSMMMSPSDDPTNMNGKISNIVNLSLEPSDSNPSTNPFAPIGTPTRFLGSSPWGTGGSLSRSPGTDPIRSLPIGSLNWGLDPSSKDQSIGNLGKKQINSASTFLSLSALPVNQEVDAWGSSRIGGGLTGLGGTKLETSHHSLDSNLTD